MTLNKYFFQYIYFKLVKSLLIIFKEYNYAAANKKIGTFYDCLNLTIAKILHT